MSKPSFITEIRQPDEPWVDAAKVAQHLGFSAHFVRAQARKGIIPAKACGAGKKKFYRFKLSHVERFMEAS